MGTVFGKIDVETPPFKSIKKTGAYEIREYDSQLAATVTYTAEDQMSNTGLPFRKLAGYIFGGNQSKKGPSNEKISMTAPVITEKGSEFNGKIIIPKKK
jgi:hypothetical protein